MKALLIDIGNSRIKGRLIDTLTSTSVDFEPLSIDRFADGWRRSLDGAAVDVAFVSNVAAADIAAAIVRWLQAMAPAIRIERVVPERATAGVVNGYRDPERLGSDRWMALVGAHTLLPDRSLLVCSFGTATTLDLLRADENGTATFVGGVILPGVEAMRAALLGTTARLGVPPGAVVDFADNTEDAISSGVLLAQTGALREAWDQACRRIPGPCECVIAGGAGRPIMDALGKSDRVIHHAPDLVLRGLGVLAHRHASRQPVD